MEDPTRKSNADRNDGVTDPNSILPIADAQHGRQARVVGIMYRGNGYGSESAWITCKTDDLIPITN